MRVYSPHASTALGLLLALGLAACSQGADVDTGAPVNFSSGGPGGAAATTDPATTDDTSSTTDDSTTADTTATTATTTTSSTTDDLTGTTAAPGCDPPVVGNYYDCTPEVGKVDNKLCMWIGSGQSVGYVSCLSSSGIPDAVTCTIIDCVDDCDCFDQPPTGTAISTCRAMATSEGESACVLDCSAGKTCPDGMECSNDICFWPP
ncbi:MAG: hypothetical protein IPK80_20520 [Nannocystis sp.]|nr:hypothetical protein [Nannocystis sp.]